MLKDSASKITAHDCQQINIYTDGAYFQNLNAGGWGYVIYCQETPLCHDSGIKKRSGSLEMELLAAIQAIKSLSQVTPLSYQVQQPNKLNNHSTKSCSANITLHTDSRIILEGLFDKFSTWERNHWKVKSGKTVVYKALWQELHDLSTKYDINWQWVKSHNGLAGNEKADQLARDAALNSTKN